MHVRGRGAWGGTVGQDYNCFKLVALDTKIKMNYPTCNWTPSYMYLYIHVYSIGPNSPNSRYLCEEVDGLAALTAADLLQFVQLASGQDLIDFLGYLITNTLLKHINKH